VRDAIQERRGRSQAGGCPDDGAGDHGRCDCDKGVTATPKQVGNLQGGVTASMKAHKWGMVVGEGASPRWRLNDEAAN
jgi:hypothetical protein